MQQVKVQIWGHVADLVFDCLYVSVLADGQPRGRLLGTFKNTASLFGDIAKRLFGQRQSPPSGIEALRHVLELLHRQLVIAHGLGGFHRDAFHKLETRMRALKDVFDEPRIQRLLLGTCPASSQEDQQTQAEEACILAGSGL